MPFEPDNRPTVMLLMDPELTRGMFDDASLRRLASLANRASDTCFMDVGSDGAGALLQDADALIIGWGAPRIDASVLARAPNLAAIFHCGGSIKPYLTKACFEGGLLVSTAAYANAIAVAEFTLAAILWANKRVLPIGRRYRGGLRSSWNPPFEQMGFESVYPDLGNYRKRVGVVGASRTGRRLIELLRPFDLDLAVCDPYLANEEATSLGCTKLSLDALCRTSDIVTLHAPELEATRMMVDRSHLARMKDGATLINTARASLIDMSALEWELRTGRLFAILDCTEPFQLPADAGLLTLDNAFVTPHISGSLGTEKNRLLNATLDELERWVRGVPLLHPVALEDLERIA